LFHLDVTKVDREMLHMLQVFQKHVASSVLNVSCIYRRMLQSFFLFGCCICFTHVLQQYVPNVLVVSVLYCSKWFHIASCNFGCFTCFTHMLQMHVSNVSSIFRCMLHSNVFHVASFYVVRSGASQGRADWACGAPGAGGRWCCGRGTLGACLSSAAHPVS
jgi:hypothetical protein